MPYGPTVCTMVNTAFAVTPTAGGTSPGIGIAYLGTIGSALATSGPVLATLITTNTSTDPFYGAGASPASFAFFNTTWLWVCDDGAPSARGGVWLFTYFQSTAKFQPSSSSSRVWSAGSCSDIALQTEAR